LSLQVRGFLIKKAHFSGKIEGQQQLLESIGETSQVAGTNAIKNEKHNFMQEKCKAINKTQLRMLTRNLVN